MKTFFVFDLDHTLIDSSHRQLTKPCGSLDLAHWKENCTRAKIFADSLLPLADNARKLIAKKAHVIACTARVMSQHDHDFLRSRGFHFQDVLSRPEANTMPDHLLKEKLLMAYAFEQGESIHTFGRKAVMFDDNESVLAHLQTFGFNCYNAISTNAALRTR